MKPFICLLFFLSLAFFGFAQDRIVGAPHATRSVVMAQNGMVATSHPLATQIGLDILKKGGTAIDAATLSAEPFIIRLKLDDPKLADSLNAGAYGHVMSSHYNRRAVAEEIVL